MKKHYLLISPVGREHIAEFEVKGKSCSMQIGGKTFAPAPKGKERRLVFASLSGVIASDENLFVYDGNVITVFCTAGGINISVRGGSAEPIILRKDGRAYIKENELINYDAERVKESLNTGKIEHRVMLVHDDEFITADYSGETFYEKKSDIKKSVVIIGGGAAAMFLAGQLAVSQKLNVTICERNQRLGKKLLATGNGRCNLANIDDSGENYTDKAAAADLFGRVPLHEILRKFSELGLAIRTEDSRVYPMSDSASGVLDVLRNRLKALGVLEKTNFDVTGVKPVESSGKYKVSSSGGESLDTDIVIFAAGSGASAKETGMAAIFSELGLKVNPEIPVLLPLPVKQKISALSGVRCEAAISAPDLPVIRGEIQFKDNHISGIPAFELSFHLAKNRAFPCNITLDFWEFRSEEQVFRHLCERKKYEGVECSEILTGLFNRRVCDCLLDAAGISIRNAEISTLSDTVLRALAKKIKAFPLTVMKNKDLTKAQSVLGGLAASEVNFSDMSVTKYQGMYAVGECVDFHGNCGGFNLMAVWAEAAVCAQGVLRDVADW